MSRQPLSKSQMKEFINAGVGEEVSVVENKKQSSSTMAEIKAEFKRKEEPVAKVRITVDLPKPIHRRLKSAVNDMETDINKLVNRLIESFLDSANY